MKIPRGDDWKGSIIVSGDFEGVAMARDQILSIVQERANKSHVQIEVERTLAPFLWVKELSEITLKELTETFPNVKINLVKTGESAHLNLTGDRSEIEIIKGLISQALIRLRSSIKSVNTFVPKPLHRLLIGPKGTILHQLEEETGCGISIPLKDEQVTIYGPEDKLLKGLSSLMERVKGMSSEKVSIPEISFKLLQNSQKYRSQLKSLDFEVFVHVNDDDFSVEVDGKKENVLNYVTKLNSILSALSSYKYHEIVEIDQEYLKHVIGRKGNNLQEIQKEFNVEIVIENENLSLIGQSESSLKKAKEYINGILSGVVDKVVLSAKIDSKYHGMLIGAKGSNLASYHEKYPSVMINFTNDDLVTFKGPRSEVEPCHAEMMAQADAIRHEMIMNSYTQTISIGKDEKLSQRDQAFLVNFARQQECKLTIEGSSLTLQGSKKKVDQTIPLFKEQVSLIQDRDVLTFSVDPKYHGILIGAEGRNLKHLIQKYSVKVDFPKSDRVESGSTEDVETEGPGVSVSAEAAEASSADGHLIKITGPKANIKKARDELLDLLKYHQDHDHQEIIEIPSKAAPFIIGKNGSVIDNIKIESDCKIDFLSGQSEGQSARVKLSGTLESIKSAKSLIEQVVKDFLDQSEVAVKNPTSLTSVFRREYRKLTTKYPNLTFYAREGVIKVKGLKETVSRAVRELESLIQSIESGNLVQIDLMVSNRVHGKILGVGGANIKELMSEYDCDIQVPRHGQGGPVVLIGPCEGVKKCAESIKSLSIEERVFKFPTPAIKNSMLSTLDSTMAQYNLQWKPHNQGILLVGDIDQIEAVKAVLGEEIAKRQADN